MDRAGPGPVPAPGPQKHSFPGGHVGAGWLGAGNPAGGTARPIKKPGAARGGGENWRGSVPGRPSRGPWEWNGRGRGTEGGGGKKNPWSPRGMIRGKKLGKGSWTGQGKRTGCVDPGGARPDPPPIPRFAGLGRGWGCFRGGGGGPRGAARPGKNSDTSHDRQVGTPAFGCFFRPKKTDLGAQMAKEKGCGVAPEKKKGKGCGNGPWGRVPPRGGLFGTGPGGGAGPSCWTGPWWPKEDSKLQTIWLSEILFRVSHWKKKRIAAGGWGRGGGGEPGNCGANGRGLEAPPPRAPAGIFSGNNSISRVTGVFFGASRLAGVGLPGGTKTAAVSIFRRGAAAGLRQHSDGLLGFGTGLGGGEGGGGTLAGEAGGGGGGGRGAHQAGP